MSARDVRRQPSGSDLCIRCFATTANELQLLLLCYYYCASTTATAAVAQSPGYNCINPVFVFLYYTYSGTFRSTMYSEGAVKHPDYELGQLKA